MVSSIIGLCLYVCVLGVTVYYLNGFQHDIGILQENVVLLERKDRQCMKSFELLQVKHNHSLSLITKLRKEVAELKKSISCQTRNVAKPKEEK